MHSVVDLHIAIDWRTTRYKSKKRNHLCCHAIEIDPIATQKIFVLLKIKQKKTIIANRKNKRKNKRSNKLKIATE